MHFANAGNYLLAAGSLAPLIPGAIGCIVIKPDGTRGNSKILTID